MTEFRSRIFDFLPPTWDREPEQGLAEAFGRIMDQLYGHVRVAGAKFNGDAAPESWLDWLLQVVHIPPTIPLTTRRKRRLINRAWNVWPVKGTEAGIESWVQGLTGVAAVVVRLNDTAFIAGWAQAGDVCGPGELAFTYEIQVPAGSITEPELALLLEPVISIFETYTFTEI